MKMISQEELKTILHYNPDTGIFTRIKSSHSNYEGKEAGWLEQKGYITITVKSFYIKAHRLAFLYMVGYIPEGEVDHINRVKDDNRWCNLREVSRTCNVRNTGNRKDNTSGVKGVNYEVKLRVSPWKVQIQINKKKYSIGLHKTLEEAVFHRFCVEQCLSWEGCDTTSPAYLWLLERNLIKEN